MKEEQDYIKDIAEIRSMMERSSKFVSLSGWAGIMAGIYAISGAYIANRVYGFNPDDITDTSAASAMTEVLLLGVIILVLALCTAIYFSYKRAGKRGERLWSATAKQLAICMAIPLLAGGILILVMISNGLVGLVAPFSLLFYGLALFNASKFTYNAVKVLGLAEIGLGLLASFFVGYGLLFWMLGFGIAHIIYGIYVYYRYER
ncbi:MAG TPA: hypothetical protein VGE26_12205 [Sphingobacteriaceae bacterium]